MIQTSLVRWKKGERMQDGNPVPDPVCGRCKKNLDMAVLKEAVYQDEMWFHTACHREGVAQLLQARQLSAVLKEAKRGIDIITSPLFQGDEPPDWHADEGKRCPRLTPNAGCQAQANITFSCWVTA
jgi:hypothetical protein